MESPSIVCMLLGPYRNFSTLTSSVLALHPLVTVLNHAGERVFANPEINFTHGYTPQKFNAFCNFALDAAKGGQKGSYGGSITLSGAFNRNQKIKDRYMELYRHGKSHPPECLIWKESHRLLYHLRENNFDFENLFDTNRKIRFLIPVRNIFHCACSNFITGHFTIGYSGVRDDPAYISGTMEERKQLINSPYAQSTILQIIEMLLADFKFLYGLDKMFPGRFLFYFQHDQPKQIFTNLLEYLMLGPDTQSIHSLFEIRPVNYSLGVNMRKEILNKINEYFPDGDSMRFNLCQFFESA